MNNEQHITFKQSIRIAVLVSAGRHPDSGRARRAVNDAQALEMGLGLAAQYPVELTVLHAGQADECALRPYLGMGIAEIQVLTVPSDADIQPALIVRLQELKPQLIFTGTQTESGWGSGCLPYCLAQTLGFPIISRIDQITLYGTAARAGVRQVLARGHRRALDVNLPALLTVDPAAPPARQSAYARARHGRLRINAIPAETVSQPFFGDRYPARKRPKRLRLDTTATAADRLKAITEVSAGHGRIVEPGTAEEAARVIYQYLSESGLLKAHS